jgi:O-antigen/teichoic acid export membrane protein
LHRFASNTLFGLGGFLWPALLTIVVTPFIVRGLGETSYGIWALVGNIMGYLSMFNSLQTAGTKYLAEYLALNDRDNIRKLLGTSLVFNLIIGILGGGAIAAFAQVLTVDIFKIPIELHSQSIAAFRLAGLGFCLGTIGWWGGAIFSGLQRFDWGEGTSIAMYSLSTLGSLYVVVWLGKGVMWVVLMNIAGTVLSIVLYLWGFRRLLPDIPWSLHFDWVMFKRIFSFGIFSTLQVIFGVLATQLDRTILGILIGVAAVTIYSIPLAVAMRIHQLCARTLGSVFPFSSDLHAQNRTDQLKRLFLRAQNLNVVLVVMCAVPLLVLTHEILSFWISPDFASKSTIVFRFLVIAYGIYAMNVVTAGITAGLGHPAYNAAFTLIFGLTSLASYFIFIPRWGVNGAGMATLIGAAVSVPLFVWYSNKKFLHVPIVAIFNSSFVRPILSGIIICGCLFLVRMFVTNVFILIFVLIASCLAYLAVSICLKVWEPKELNIAFQLLNRIKNLLLFKKQ